MPNTVIVLKTEKLCRKAGPLHYWTPAEHYCTLCTVPQRTTSVACRQVRHARRLDLTHCRSFGSRLDNPILSAAARKLVSPMFRLTSRTVHN